MLLIPNTTKANPVEHACMCESVCVCLWLFVPTLRCRYEQLGTLHALHQLPRGKYQLRHLRACRRRLERWRWRCGRRSQHIGQRRRVECMSVGRAAAAGIILWLLLVARVAGRVVAVATTVAAVAASVAVASTAATAAAVAVAVATRAEATVS